MKKFGMNAAIVYFFLFLSTLLPAIDNHDANTRTRDSDVVSTEKMPYERRRPISIKASLLQYSFPTDTLNFLDLFNAFGFFYCLDGKVINLASQFRKQITKDASTLKEYRRNKTVQSLSESCYQKALEQSHSKSFYECTIKFPFTEGARKSFNRLIGFFMDRGDFFGAKLLLNEMKRQFPSDDWSVSEKRQALVIYKKTGSEEKNFTELASSLPDIVELGGQKLAKEAFLAELKTLPSSSGVETSVLDFALDPTDQTSPRKVAWKEEAALTGFYDGNSCGILEATESILQNSELTEEKTGHLLYLIHLSPNSSGKTKVLDLLREHFIRMGSVQRELLLKGLVETFARKKLDFVALKPVVEWALLHEKEYRLIFELSKTFSRSQELAHTLKGALLKSLNDHPERDLDNTLLAIRNFPEMERSDFVEPLIKRSREPGKANRSKMIRILGDWQVPEAREMLWELIKSDKEPLEARKSALIAALQYSGAPYVEDTTKYLLGIAGDKSVHIDYKYIAINQVSKLEAAGIPVLLEFAEKEGVLIRNKALTKAIALVPNHSESFPALFKVIANRPARDMSAILGELERSGAKKEHIAMAWEKLALSPNTENRLELLNILRKNKRDAKACALIAKLKSDEAATVRERAMAYFNGCPQD